MTTSSQCHTCANYVGYRLDGSEDDRPVCAAYPEGIPEAIMLGTLDHTVRQAGDGGITWEPRPGTTMPTEDL